MTRAEVHIWNHVLRGGQMRGYTFRRQRPVLQYIADFMCQPLLLIVEIDGYTHRFPEVHAKDEHRTANLEAAGFQVLRFTDEEVLTDVQQVAEVLAYHVEEAELRLLKSG
ncbi:MAG: hypothetical protein OHK0039_44260 [Bacteroidia bacterium]